MKTKTKRVIKKKTAPRKKRSTVSKSGITGYLVIWRHTMDDVPVGLFADREEAFKVAKTMTKRTAGAAAIRLGFEVSTPVCFTVVHFEKGKPVDFLSIDREDDYC